MVWCNYGKDQKYMLNAHAQNHSIHRESDAVIFLQP